MTDLLSRVFGARISHREWFPRWDTDPLAKTLLLILALIVFPAWVLREWLRGQL